jgi:hypothetical protein
MPVFIRFIADRGPISRAIGFRTLGKPSHVEYVLTYASGEPYGTFGSRLVGGISYRPYDYCKPTWEEWYTFPGIEASYTESLEMQGRKYDWKDICELLIGWHPKGYDPVIEICSVCVGYGNRRAWAKGTSPPLINPSVPTWEITPTLLYGAVTQQIEVYKKP